MSNISAKEFEVLSSFSPGHLMELILLCDNLGVSDPAIDAVKEYIEEQQRTFKSQYPDTGQRAFIPVCPECGLRINLRQVREPFGPGNRFGFLSCWECGYCAWEQYSKNSYFVELKRVQRAGKL